MQETGTSRASLKDEQVFAPQNSTDEATMTPVGRRGMQVGEKQMPVGSSRCLAQRRRDTTSSGPIRLRHHLTKFPV
jgi:hypothetical protein